MSDVFYVKVVESRPPNYDDPLGQRTFFNPYMDQLLGKVVLVEEDKSRPGYVHVKEGISCYLAPPWFERVEQKTSPKQRYEEVVF